MPMVFFFGTEVYRCPNFYSSFLELPVDDLQEYVNLLRKEQEDEGPVRIDYNSLNAETAFCWRCLGEHAKSMGVDGEQLLDQLLPEVSGFCKYIQG